MRATETANNSRNSAQAETKRVRDELHKAEAKVAELNKEVDGLKNEMSSLRTENG